MEGEDSLQEAVGAKRKALQLSGGHSTQDGQAAGADLKQKKGEEDGGFVHLFVFHLLIHAHGPCCTLQKYTRVIRFQIYR